ncbi:MAG: three-Cys-motif partner protein TcmP [Actinomycetota bacterium]|nr:three-Cys-motif partner protein TcmP [Actinomycetota bacterium]
MTPPDGAGRQWHAWSVWKTRVLLNGYLPAYAKACAKKATHITFIDGFAGTADSTDWNGESFLGSPRLALRTNPRFTHAVFFELPQKAEALDQSLHSEFPGRQFHVVAGDCNQKIQEGLAWLRSQGSPTSGPQLGPVLAFLDPDALELEWTTVEAIAGWTGQRNPGDYHRRGKKPELLVLFPTGPMRRTLPADKGAKEAGETRKQQVDRLFGGRDWRAIYQAQRAGLIQGESAWMHYVELYRLRLLALGYEYTSAIEVRNTSNVVLYHMVFATCHPAGARIMKAVQENARKVLPAMVQEEKRARRQSGRRLFEESDADLDRYAEAPSKWAQLFDEPPQPFDPSRFQLASASEQLAMGLAFDDA